MADVTITAANVQKPSTGATIEAGTAGEAVTAGQTVYKSSDGSFYLADADATAVAGNSSIDDVYGIALNSAAEGQPLTVMKKGTITIGGTVVIGTVYVQSATAGGICPWADLVATDYVTIVGVAKTSGTIELGLIATGVQIPA